MHTNYYNNLSISYDLMLINLSLASILSCLNYVGIKPHKDKMLTKMYKFFPLFAQERKWFDLIS